MAAREWVLGGGVSIATRVNTAGGAAMAAGNGRAGPGGRTPDHQTPINSLQYNWPKQQKTPLSARGHLSTWPAFASGQTVPRNHQPCCAPGERPPSTKLALLTVPKPRLLEQLESYLKKELQSLNLTKNNSQELKLQPYRETFEFFIDSFKTYKPLLSAIKHEYEVTVAHQKKTIRALEPLKAMVTTTSEECTRQILELQEKEKDEIKMLKQEKQRLLKFTGNLKEENHSLQMQVEHLQRSLTETYAHYLDEGGGRKLLLRKLNDMQNELDRTQRQAQDIKGKDVKLKLALETAQKDLKKAQVKLNAVTADAELLEKKYAALLQEMETLQKDSDVLHKENETLLKIHRETAAERDNLCAELQRLQC
ncbi:LOW QUALITY PROTEIN: translin-associated factor X-interacting protein 1 [Pterocles gutturalis]